MSVARRKACPHGFDFPDTRCDLCMDIADDERWISFEKRQLDAAQFACDQRSREIDRRQVALVAKQQRRADLKRRAKRAVG